MYSHKFSVAGLNKTFFVESKYSSLNPNQKKKIRWLIASNLSRNYLPFHSCLVEKNGKGFLICGPSGSGKSTLSTYFIKHGYRVLAKDFVIIWREKDKLFAGDLNFVSENSFKDKTEIAKAFFLSIDDKRDIFSMNLEEASLFYIKCMSPWKRRMSNKYIKSAIFNILLRIHVSFGNRINKKRWYKLIDIYTKINKTKSVGIIGVGNLGQDIANLVIDLSKLKCLNLYSRNYEKIKSIAYDLKSARPDLEINTYKNKDIAKCIKNSGILIFSFRSSDIEINSNVQERYGRLHSHSEIIWYYTRLLRKIKYSGTVLLLTNPVDVLSYLTYIYSNMNIFGSYDWKGLFSNQVFGVGIGVDYLRLKTLGNNDLELVGEHGDNQYLSRVRSGKLIYYDDPKLLNKVKRYSQIIRRGVDRTRFGPSHETVRIINSMFSNNTSLLRLSVISSNGMFWGRPIRIVDRIPVDEYKIDVCFKKYIDEHFNYIKELNYDLF